MTAWPARRGRHAERPRVGVIGPGLFARSTLLPLLEKLGRRRRRRRRHVAAARGRRRAQRAGARVRVTTPRRPDRRPRRRGRRHRDAPRLARRARRRARSTAGKAVFLEKPLAIDERRPRALLPRALRAAGGWSSTSTAASRPAAERVAAPLRGPRRPARRAVPRQRRRAPRGPLAARPGGRRRPARGRGLPLRRPVLGDRQRPLATRSPSRRSAPGPATLAGGQLRPDARLRRRVARRRHLRRDRLAADGQGAHRGARRRPLGGDRRLPPRPACTASGASRPSLPARPVKDKGHEARCGASSRSLARAASRRSRTSGSWRPRASR